MPAVFLRAGVGPRDLEAGRGLRASYLANPFVAAAALAVIEAAWQPPRERR